ncbi:MAG: calcium-binding protein [Limnohabitans sp.]
MSNSIQFPPASRLTSGLPVPAQNLISTPTMALKKQADIEKARRDEEAQVAAFNAQELVPSAVDEAALALAHPAGEVLAVLAQAQTNTNACAVVCSDAQPAGADTAVASVVVGAAAASSADAAAEAGMGVAGALDGVPAWLWALPLLAAGGGGGGGGAPVQADPCTPDAAIIHDKTTYHYDGASHDLSAPVTGGLLTIDMTANGDFKNNKPLYFETEKDGNVETLHIELGSLVDLHASGYDWVNFDSTGATSVFGYNLEGQYYRLGGITESLTGSRYIVSAEGGDCNNILFGYSEGTINSAGSQHELRTYPYTTLELSGGGGNDLLFGSNWLDNSGTNKLDGGDGNDYLQGGHATNLLTGGAGNDVLVAGDLTNTMTGGAGNDVFTFVYGSTGQTVITDFNIGDTLALYDDSITGTYVYTKDNLSQIDSLASVVLTSGLSDSHGSYSLVSFTSNSDTIKIYSTYIA